MAEMRTIYSVQFLRGFAALLVLQEHVRLELGQDGYGGVGVDLFFIISGFIIFYVTEASQKNFMIKRMMRIIPLYWAATLCVAAITLIKPTLLNSAEFSLDHFLMSLLFLPHWTDAQGLRPLLALGWTLNYEMMFYLIFALAMRLSHTWRFEIAAILLISLMVVTNLFLPQDTKTGLAFYQAPIQLEFIFGMAIARWLSPRSLPQFQGMALLTSGIVLFFAVNITQFTGIRLVDNGLPAATLFIAALLAEPLFSRRPVMQRLSLLGGEISYALYLSHIYVMAMLSRLVGLQGLTFWITCFTLIPLLAWIIHHVVERPATLRLRGLILKRVGQQISE